jgi:branched-chain amino acid transport system ATP-binding protein
MMLHVEKVSRTFGGLRAVKDVSFQLAEGEFLGLIGPNGAGKTTLFNCINGVYPPTTGTVIFRGQRISGLPTYKVAHLGLARTHQIVRPLNELSVRENVMVGACFGRHQHTKKQAQRVADAVMETVGLGERAEQPASSLNIAQKKRLELARALAAEPYLLLLDEVLAGLNASEVAVMIETIRQIRARGVTIIMIEHIMRAVMGLSDRILVLNYGELIAEGTPSEVAANPQVIEAYLGSPELAAQLGEEAQR